MSTSAPEDSAAEHSIGWTEKNSREVWRVNLAKFKGHDLVNLRAFVVEGRNGEAVNIPTRNGLVIRPAQLEAVISLLQMALNEARERGLIEGEAANDR